MEKAFNMLWMDKGDLSVNNLFIYSYISVIPCESVEAEVILNSIKKSVSFLLNQSEEIHISFAGAQQGD